MKSYKNKNRNIYAGLLLFLLMSMTTACDPLGIEPTSKVDEDRFWENAQLARAYVNDFYTFEQTTSGQNFQAEQWSDNCQGNDEQDWDTYRQKSFNQRLYDENTTISVLGSSSNNETKQLPWSKSYKSLRSVNLGIEKVTASTVINDQLKNQLLGECYFFRAFLYFDMIKFFGAVPYVDKALNVGDETYLPQAKREVILDNILADLKLSQEHFDEYAKLNGTTPAIGMINRNVATAFMSRVALYAANAAEASTRNLYTDDAKQLFVFEKVPEYYYQLAYDAAYSLIGKYSLETKYEDLFTKENSHSSSESIWPVMFKENQRSGFNPTAVNGPDGKYYGASTAWDKVWDFRSGLFPTQDLVDCYLQKDAVTGEWKKWWETSQAKAMNVTLVNGEISGQSADYRDIYKDRDQRFYATVTYDGSYMGPENDNRYIIQTWVDATDPVNTLKYSSLHSGFRTQENLNTAPVNRSSTQTITGYYSRKYSQFNSYNEDGTINKNQRQTSYFNIRYAEVLLNCAEASIKLGKADAAGYINQIRQRAGLSNFSGSDLWEEMKVQRRLEFAFENPGFRYFDLLRWAEADGKKVIEELNKPSRGILIMRKGVESQLLGEQGNPVDPTDPTYFTPIFTTFVMNYASYQRKFDNVRYYFYPHPLSRLRDYKELQQNPGWTNFNYNN